MGSVYTDTSDFFSIDQGDIIEIGRKRYKVTGHAREGRFGMDDPKFWVKRVIDLETGDKKIMKLSFLESFDRTLAGIKIKSFRNPDKEGAILRIVGGHPSFMQGESFRDIKNNSVRVLDIVHGPDFFSYMDSLDMSYAAYYQKLLPGILQKIVKAFEAIRFLHVHDFKHGDIRNDHIIIERDTGNYVWIDFDYDYDTSENPWGLDIFGLGNILLYAVGKGFHDLHLIKREKNFYGDLFQQLLPEDFSIIHKWRLINLRKLYPQIPVPLNNILMHFSYGAEVFYESVEEMIEDVNRCLYSFFLNEGDLREKTRSSNTGRPG